MQWKRAAVVHGCRPELPRLVRAKGLAFVVEKAVAVCYRRRLNARPNPSRDMHTAADEKCELRRSEPADESDRPCAVMDCWAQLVQSNRARPRPRGNPDRGERGATAYGSSRRCQSHPLPWRSTLAARRTETVSGEERDEGQEATSARPAVAVAQWTLNRRKRAGWRCVSIRPTHLREFRFGRGFALALCQKFHRAGRTEEERGTKPRSASPEHLSSSP